MSILFGVFSLKYVAWYLYLKVLGPDPLSGSARLGSFALGCFTLRQDAGNLSFGNFRVGSFVWVCSRVLSHFGIVVLGHLAWDLSCVVYVWSL